MPTSPLRVVLDTDTYNEVDDQFALAHLLLSPGQVRFEAVYAAPFLNERSTGPADGMEKSYDEIHRVLELVPGAVRPRVCHGSRSFLADARLPVESDAAHDLVERAMRPGADRLYVAGIAAATNIASALLMEPRIAERIVVVWLGGHAAYWPTAREFNLKQDLHAARILFDSGVPLVRLPCEPVVSHLSVSVAELAEAIEPYSRLGAFLTARVREFAGNPLGWSKVIWDIAASARVIQPNWIPTRQVPSPILQNSMDWGAPESVRHLVEEAISVNRNAIFADFFAKAKTADQAPRA
jgi:purine nucleosidase